MIIGNIEIVTIFVILLFLVPILWNAYKNDLLNNFSLVELIKTLNKSLKIQAIIVIFLIPISWTMNKFDFQYGQILGETFYTYVIVAFFMYLPSLAFLNLIKLLLEGKMEKKIEKKIPFNLDKGIYFEDSKNILLWSSDFQKISKIDNPEISDNGNILRWSNKLCFGGQILNVIISKNEYYNKSGRLEFVNFEEGNGKPWETYKKYSEIFKKQVGKPNEFKDDGYGRPTELWNIEDLQIIIGVGERFTEFEIFGIHKGKQYWNLNK